MNIKRILAAVDGSELSDRAAVFAAALADSLRADLALVHVVDLRAAAAPHDGAEPPPDMLPVLRKVGRVTLSAAERLVSPGRRVETLLREGFPGQDICEAAREWGADLVVLGTHGRRGISRLLMGSTAEWVLRHASCPALIIPAAALGARATRAGEGMVAQGASEPAATPLVAAPAPAASEGMGAIDVIDEASKESFPGSDPPGWIDSHS